MASDTPTSADSGWPDFLLLCGASLGLVAVGVTIFAVSLPDGLKFVLAATVGMLTVICLGLIRVVRR